MVLYESIITIISAIVIAALFFYVFRTTGPWGNFWSFVLILVLAGLAAKSWVNPIGPVVWGVAWLPIVTVILLFAVLLSAATPDNKKRNNDGEKNAKLSSEEKVPVTIGLTFWILIFILMLAAGIGFFNV